MASKLDTALELAQQGFSVFPIAAGKKTPPLLNGWPQRATSDPAEVVAFWTPVPDANIGIHCDGLLVLDIDPKNDGYNSLLKLEVTHGELPRTYEVATPSGGRHLYYRVANPVGNNVSRLGAGIDVRGRGGYVVAAGSTTDAGDYTVHRLAKIAVAPDWLAEAVGRAPEDKAPAAPAAAAAPEVVGRALAWLATQEPAIEGQGGDAHTFAVACGLRDLGVGRQQAFAALQEEWNGRCSPPWMPDDLWTKVCNAYAYAQNEPGGKAAAAEDFPVVVPESQSVAPKPARPAAKALRLGDLALAVSNALYVIKGVLYKESYANLYGAPGEGKTFAALDIAYHVAAGLEWMKHKVRAGVVLYLAYEGTGGLVKRAQALRRNYGEKDVPLYIAPVSFNLREPKGRQELGALLATLPEKPVLVVIDTFARALQGGDENSAQDVGAFNQAVAALVENTGACVLIVHHSGKNKSAGARGSSALLGAIDTELECDGGQIIAKKQRDVEVGPAIGFKLRPVLVGMDEDGDELTSCVVEPAAVLANGPTAKISGNAKRGFDVLCDLSPQNAPVSMLKWREACLSFLGERDSAKRFHDIKRGLVSKRYIVIDEVGNITRRME